MKAATLLLGLLWMPLALADSAGRDANEAERAFSLKLHEAAQRALRNVPGTDWTATETEIRAEEWADLDIASRPYSLTHQMDLQVDPATERGARLQAEYEALTQAPGGPPADFLQRFNRIQSQMGASIVVEFNPPSAGLTLLEDAKPLWQAITVPGATHAVRATGVQGRGGGGADSAVQATALYLGAWSKPALGEAGELQATAKRKTGAPYLSVQQVFIRVEAPPEIGDALIKRIDFDALIALIK